MAFEYTVGNPGIEHLDESKLVSTFENSILENDSLEQALGKTLNVALEDAGRIPKQIRDTLDALASKLNQYDLFSRERKLMEALLLDEREILKKLLQKIRSNEEVTTKKIDDLFKPQERVQQPPQQEKSEDSNSSRRIHSHSIQKILKSLDSYQPRIREDTENPPVRFELPEYRQTSMNSAEMHEVAQQVEQFLKAQSSLPSEKQILEKLNRLNSPFNKLSKSLEHLQNYHFLSKFSKSAFGRLKLRQRDRSIKGALEANEAVQEHPSGIPSNQERNEAISLLSTIAELKENNKLLPPQQKNLERMLSEQERIELISGQQSLGGENKKAELSKRVSVVLQEKGMVKLYNGEYILTPKALRQVARRCLSEIFSDLKKGMIGRHETNKVSYNGLEMRDSVKPYEFGDALHLEIPETLRNALRKSTQVPIGLDYSDFVVRETGNVTNSATVIAIDVSGSMGGLPLLAAKKITLALECLIEERFKGDYLDVIAFSDNAQIVPRYAMARMRDESSGFTNFQEALLLSGKLLSRKKALNKQIILVSDMEPTMCSYSPPANFIQRMNIEIDKQKELMTPEKKKAISDYYTQRELTMQLDIMSSVDLSGRQINTPLAAALYEASRLSKQKIPVNFYMMGNHPPLESLIPFYSRFTTGKIFTPKADSLGKAVMYDFLKGSGKQIG